MSLGKVEEVKRTVRTLIKKFDYEKRELNQPLLKKLKELIKRDDQLIPEFVDAIFVNLKSQDSDKRLCIVLLVDYFFQRTHAFRTAIVDSLQEFLVYTVELDPLYFPLPSPPQAATFLKKETLQIFKLWVEKYVGGYPKLENAKTVLLSSKTFDFARADGQTEVERNRAEADRIRKDIIDKKCVDQILLDFSESKAHVKESIIEAQTMISLIVPDFREYENTADASSEAGPSTASPTISKTLIISVPDKIIIEKTADNEELINSFKDNQKLLIPNLKKVNNWISKMTRHGGSGEILKEMLELQRNLNQEIQKTKDIKIIERRKAIITKGADAMEEDSEDDDSDGFEDVDINVADPEGLMNEEGAGKKDEGTVDQEMLEQIAEMEKRERAEKLKKKKDEPSSSKSSKVPTLNYGLDLKYWGKEVQPAEVAKNRTDGHPFWRAPDEDQIGQESEDIYRTRVITFVGDMPEITRTCRAPLPSGRLCPRMDRVNCPLHGPIVDRDEDGVIVGGYHHEPKQSQEQQPGPSTAIQYAVAEYEQKRKDEEEDALWRDLEKQTGGKFSYALAKKQKKKKDAPKKREKSAHQKTRDRLCTKLLNKRSMKRVTDHLDAIQKNKAAKRFAHQFNY